MTHTQRQKQLATLGWHPETDPQTGRQLEHRICGERCYWFTGRIDGIEWHAWISEVSGMVYLHTSPAIDKTFDEFIALVRDGWPKPKAAPVVRGFDFGDD